MNQLLKYKGWLIAGGIVVLVVGFLLYASSVYTSVRNGGNEREIALTSKYSSIQAAYGQWRLGVTDSLNISREKRDAMDKILQNAIAGRYNKGGAQPDKGTLLSVIKEAYPDLNGLNVYDQLMGYVKQGRDRFGRDQEAMQKQIADYNTWRKTGSLLHPWFASFLFPGDNLVARVGDKKYTGAEALEKMSTVLVGADTTKIFDTGVDEGVVTPEKKK